MIFPPLAVIDFIPCDRRNRSDFILRTRQSRAPVTGVPLPDHLQAAPLILGRHSHSLTLNTFCIINVCLIPSGDSDSLWYSYSLAYTAFGYQNVITMITRGLIAVGNDWFPHIHYTISGCSVQKVVRRMTGMSCPVSAQTGSMGVNSCC